MAWKKAEGSESAQVSSPVVKAASTGGYDELKAIIERAYEGDVTIDEAERLAAKFLLVQMDVAAELSSSDLDARMKKNGLKAKRAQAYMSEVARNEKKPSDTLLEQHVAMDPGCQIAAEQFEQADAKRESLHLYFNIFKDAHIYFRGISKGRYE